MHTKTVQFLFKIPVLQRLFFPVRMWESFPLNFKLIQTTWIWNLAPEIFQPKGLGATWQDAALQKVMALTAAPWSSCLHKPIPPQTILSTEHETHISLPCTSAKPERMWRQWERFWSSRELLLLFPLFTPFHIRPMCLTLGTWSQVGADCLQVGSICNATSSVTFWMPRPALEPKIISWIYFLSIKAWWGSATGGTGILPCNRGTVQTAAAQGSSDCWRNSTWGWELTSVQPLHPLTELICWDQWRGATFCSRGHDYKGEVPDTALGSPLAEIALEGSSHPKLNHYFLGIYKKPKDKLYNLYPASRLIRN